jgi:hypothetical protein
MMVVVDWGRMENPTDRKINNGGNVENEAQLAKLQKKEWIYRVIGMTLIVIGVLLFLPWLLSFIQATRVPVPREMILALGIFLFLVPPAGIGVLFLLHAKHLRREIREIYNSMGTNHQPL